MQRGWRALVRSGVGAVSSSSSSSSVCRVFGAVCGSGSRLARRVQGLHPVQLGKGERPVSVVTTHLPYAFPPSVKIPDPDSCI